MNDRNFDNLCISIVSFERSAIILAGGVSIPQIINHLPNDFAAYIYNACPPCQDEEVVVDVE